MKYARILLAVANEIWAMQPEKIHAVIEVLRFQALGGKYDEEELQARITKQDEKEVARRAGSVALMPLRGVISNRANMLDDISGGTSSEMFGRAFTAAVRDDTIKAVVIDIDSPGGAVSGSDELSSMIFDARGVKPIVAHVNANMASAAYWIGTAADEVVVTPSGAVGSIGVYGVHDDISKALADEGINKTLIASGKYKVEGNPFEPLSDDARAYMQTRVDAAHSNFVRTVARNRGTTISAVRDGFGQGRMVDAPSAIDQGMADKIGTLEDTLNRFGASQFQPAKKAGASADARRRALELAHGRHAIS